MTRTRTFALSIGLLVVLGLVAGGFVAASAAAPAADEELPDALERIVEQWQERAWVPGVAVSVRQGQFSWSKAVGYADEETEAPLRTDMPFPIASVTKPFVAATVLRLVEQGAIDLDAPTTRYVPSFPDAGGVTIRQLLAMRSGLPDYTQAFGFLDDVEEDLYHRRSRTGTPQELLDLVAGYPPDFAPGERYAYSNTNYILLGEVIRAVTGRAWHEAVTEQVLAPLGLDDTLWSVEGVPGMAPGHSDLDRDGFRDGLAGRPLESLFSMADAAGGLVSTAEDLTTFAAGVYGGELLAAESLAAMTTVDRIGYEREYGLGTLVQQPDLRTTVVGHTGGMIGYATMVWYAPEHDLAIAVLVNDSTGEPEDLAQLLLRHILRATHPAPGTMG
jgi:D-alanyl-D-alanine carboxypeptidase